MNLSERLLTAGVAVAILGGIALGIVSLWFLSRWIRRRKPPTAHLISAWQIDAFVGQLSLLEQPQFQGSVWQIPDQRASGVQLPYSQLSESADRCWQALQLNGWIYEFNWAAREEVSAWGELADQCIKSPERLATVDAETIRKIFTTPHPPAKATWSAASETRRGPTPAGSSLCGAMIVADRLMSELDKQN